MILCAKFGWNCPSGSEEEVQNVKRLRTDWSWQIDSVQKMIRKAHLSSGEFKKKGHCNIGSAIRNYEIVI